MKALLAPEAKGILPHLLTQERHQGLSPDGAVVAQAASSVKR